MPNYGQTFSRGMVDLESMIDFRKKLSVRLPVIMLLVATVVFWSFYDRYEAVGPMLLELPTLANATRTSGETSEFGSRFTLNVPESGKRAEIRFRLPTATDYSMIRVRARIKLEEVVVGKYGWHCARLLLVQYDTGNKWIPGHHGLVAEKGTKDWERHEDVFEIFPSAAYAEVALQQSGTAGRAEFDRIEAQPVRVRASFIWWRLLFAITWVVASVYYYPRCRLHRRKLKLLIFLNVLAILAGSLMPGDWIADGSEQAKAVFAKVTKPDPGKADAPSGAKSKIKQGQDSQRMDRFNKVVGDTHRTGHFILFASLCFLVYLSAALERQHPLYFLKVGFDVLLFAAVSESLQFLTLDRSAGVSDLKVDFYGMLAAFLIFLIVLPLVRRMQVKEGLEV